MKIQLPQAFIDKYQELLKEEAADFFAAITNASIKKGFRINPLKPNAQAMVEKYYPEPLQKAPYAKEGYLGEVSGRSLLHQAGYVYSQEPSAMIVASVANAKPGEKILDLCAAPGGKSTQLAGQLHQQGLLVANEIMPKRAKILSENLERWGAKNVVVTNHAPEQLTQFFPKFFDKIVVDAPCSGEGMFRKDEEAIAQWQIDTPLTCAKRQKTILNEAVKMLKPGGELIYSTCTFAPEENEAIISWLVEHHGLTIEPIELSSQSVSSGRNEWGSVPGLEQTIRLWPHLNEGEGHFVAKLRLAKNTDQKMLPEATSPCKAKKKNKKSGTNSKLTKEQEQLWQAFYRQFPISLTGQLTTFGDHLWLVPQELPTLQELKVLRAGIHLGEFKKKRFEPSFALAMALEQPKHYPNCQLSLADWEKYVRGQTIECPGNQGWVVLIVDEIAIGFGKQVQGLIKNFYPKGLRLN